VDREARLRKSRLVWTALEWAAVALQQVDRITAAWEPYKASMMPPDGGSFFRRETPETRRPRSLFWADVHFLMISVRHLATALEMIDDDPRLSQTTSKHAEELRHLVEHWEKAERGEGAWKGLRDRHGDNADPRQLMFDPPHFKIGHESLSITELADDVRRVERELTALELEL
jgi:hypothetical protein